MKYLLGYSGSNETWWEFLGFFYLQGVCVCVRACVCMCGGGGGGANCQLAEDGHL